MVSIFCAAVGFPPIFKDFIFLLKIQKLINLMFHYVFYTLTKLRSHFLIVVVVIKNTSYMPNIVISASLYVILNLILTTVQWQVALIPPFYR